MVTLEAHPHSPSLEIETFLFKPESICLGLSLGGERGAEEEMVKVMDQYICPAI